MKRLVCAVSLGFLCLTGTAFAQVFNNNYYFSPNSNPNYSDLQIVKATELVNEDEIITVGYSREPLNNSKNDIILVKTKASSGGVIWAKRYGLEDLDERAHGLTVSIDGKHVIVVGTAQNKEVLSDWNALAMKVEISSGNVIWAGEYGEKDTREDARMIEKDRSVIGIAEPNYFIVGSTSKPNVLKSILFAFSIKDNGSQIWSHRYMEAGTFSLINDVSYTMVQNKKENFIISGTRYETNKPSRIFTVGINPFDGLLSDKYLQYDINNLYEFGGAVCNVIGSENEYALAYQTRNPGVDPNVNTAITVVRLDKDRTPKWTGFYWQDGHSLNQGLSIYQSVEDSKLLDVYTNTVRSVNSPGFLNLKSDGSVNYFIKYNFNESRNNKYPTALVQTKYGYTAKALHRDGENGFLLAGVHPNGKTECAEEEKMEVKKPETKVDSRDYKEEKYGEPKKREVKVIEVFGKAEECDGTGGYSFKRSDVAEEVEDAEETAFSVYPNPLSSADANLTLDINTAEGRVVQINIYNSLGQLTHTEQQTLAAGANQISIDATVLSTGINMLNIQADGQPLYQETVVKQ